MAFRQPVRQRLGRNLTAAAGACALVLLGLWSCSGDDAYPPGSPCATMYQDQCGSTCAGDDACPAGLHCRDGKCFAQCTPGGAECLSGQCDDRGRCTGSGGGGTGGDLFGGSSASSSGNGGAGGACGSVNVTFEPQTPTVALLIDQSGSMTANFNGQPRWDVVYDVLMDPNGGVVQQLQSQVRFGLVLYTYASGPTCPELVEVMPPALDNYAAIDAVYSQESPIANTPTGDSLVVVAAALDQFQEPGPKLIILATDGDPDRCEDPNGHDQISKDEVTDAAQAAYLQGIETVIIAVGDQVSQTHQQDVANAGAGLPVPAPNPCNDPAQCAPTYEPATKQAMIDAFTAIINGKRTCVFTLDGQVVDGKECQGTVTVNGQIIGCNDPDGWKLNNPSEIEFVGAACDTIMNDPNVTVEASFPCGSYVPGPN